MKNFLRKRLRNVGFDIVKYAHVTNREIPNTAILDKNFPLLWEKHKDKTMVPWQAVYAAYTAAQHISQSKVPGAIVECGVWRGGCSLIMAEALLVLGDTQRDLYLYDTFAGMTEPTKEDTKTTTGTNATAKYESRKSGEVVDWCYAPIEEVQNYVNEVAYPNEKIHLVKGRVEDTIGTDDPKKIALLRLDTDWYESTKHTLEYLYPRVAEGGIVIFDDYGKWAGARKAVEDYFIEHGNRPFLMLETVSGNMVGIKPPTPISENFG